ncbi:hypothetical protein P8452_31488 [Trifolium repens]|nr:hypothetical protein P8452_31488 [Trifolium repens]
MSLSSNTKVAQLEIRFCLVKISIEAAMEGTLHSQRLRWNCHRQAHTTGTSSRSLIKKCYDSGRSYT